MNYIDAHVHIWTDDAKYPLAHEPAPGLRPIPHYGPESILREAAPEGITRVVLVQSSFYGLDHRYITDTIAAQPERFRGIAVVDPHAMNVTQEMKRLRSLGVTGFRIEGLGGDLGRWLDAPGFADVFACAASERAAVCPLVNPAALPALSRMCDRFPETTVVIDHFARIGAGGVIRPEDVDFLCGMARHPKVHVKVSAFYGLGKAVAPYDDMIPLIRRVYDAFGAMRLMWASDGPYQSLLGSYSAAVALIRDRVAFFSAADREEILRGTAERVFFR